MTRHTTAARFHSITRNHLRISKVHHSLPAVEALIIAAIRHPYREVFYLYPTPGRTVVDSVWKLERLPERCVGEHDSAGEPEADLRMRSVPELQEVHGWRARVTNEYHDRSTSPPCCHHGSARTDMFSVGTASAVDTSFRNAPKLYNAVACGAGSTVHMRSRAGSAECT
jgi:hypothetical protein